jgi:hypothetical protein
VAGCQIAFAMGMALYLLSINPNSVGYGLPPLLAAVLVFPVLGLVLTVLYTAATAFALIKRRVTIPMGIAHPIFALAAWVFLWTLHYWNLLGLSIT